jgi:diguanylate cyclase (GGDEF)-like protein
MPKTEDILFNYLRDIIYSPMTAELDLDTLPDNFKKVGEGMQFLAKCIREQKELGDALVEADFYSKSPDIENVLAAPLMDVQGAFRHITWQTQRVAEGDYAQRVDFMGEFAEAFNTMVRQLDEKQQVIEKNEEELRRLAWRDSLTGFFNRSRGMELIQQWYEQGLAFCTAFVDIDNLKTVNDVYGHKKGDEYILMITKTLATIPGTSIMSRIGGDEFLLAVQGVHQEALEQNLEALRKAEEKKRLIGISAFIPGFSYGVTEICPGEGVSITEYIGTADQRMYHYKNEHKRKNKKE